MHRTAPNFFPPPSFEFLQLILSEQQRLLRRHIRERKELEDHFQKLKCSIPPTDKEGREAVLRDFVRLDAELDRRQVQELDKFHEDFVSGYMDVDSGPKDLDTDDPDNQPGPASQSSRRQEGTASHDYQKDSPVLATKWPLVSFSREEERRLALLLRVRDLEMKAIKPDSHCLYRAVQDQLPFPVSVGSLRRLTARYMKKHAKEFLPLLQGPDGLDRCTRREFLMYCHQTACRAVRGGQLELRALAHVLKTPIQLIRYDAPPIVFGEEYCAQPITVVYVHFSEGYGEHYNSVKPLEIPGPIFAPAARRP
ncbi:OTU domain-containing protein 6A [Ctenodactylus gundi]